MTSTWLPTVSPTNPSSETWGASSQAGRNRNMPSPPSTPAENAKLTFSSSSGEGENTACPIRFQIDGPAVGGRGVDVEREHLVAQDPAVGPVGELDAEPVIVRGAPDRGQHLAHLGAVDRRGSRSPDRCARRPPPPPRARAPDRRPRAAPSQRRPDQTEQDARARAPIQGLALKAAHPHLDEVRLRAGGREQHAAAVGLDPGRAGQERARRDVRAVHLLGGRDVVVRPLQRAGGITSPRPRRDR